MAQKLIAINRVIACILCIILLAIACMGCEEPPEEKKQIEKKQIVLDIDEKASRNIKFAFNYSIEPYRMKAVFAEIGAQTSSTLGFKLDSMTYGGKLYPMMDMSVSPTGIEYDIVNKRADVLETMGAFRYLAKNGLIMDLTDLLPKYAPTYMSKLTEKHLEKVTWEGKIMGIPALEMALPRYCVIARKDLLEKFKISDINNLDEYERFLKLVKENEPDYDPAGFGEELETVLMTQAGYVDIGSEMVYRWNDPEMRVVPWEQTEAFAYAVEYMNRWKNEKYCPISGRPVASYIMRLDKIDLFRDKNISSEMKVFVLNEDMPMLYYEDLERVMVIAKDSPNAINVLMFLEWLYSDRKNYELFMYGIEGEDYIVKEGKKQNIKYPAYRGPDFFRYSEYEERYADDPENLNAVINEVKMQDSILCPVKSFIYFTNVQTDLINQRGELIKNETHSDRGHDIDIAEYIKKQKKAGADTLAAQLQKKLDEWRGQREGK